MAQEEEGSEEEEFAQGENFHEMGGPDAGIALPPPRPAQFEIMPIRPGGQQLQLRPAQVQLKPQRLQLNGGQGLQPNGGQRLQLNSVQPR